MPEHVRSEIHSRVERFKARRRGQTLPLPFEEPLLADEDKIVPFPTLEAEQSVKVSRTRASREAKPARVEVETHPRAVAEPAPAPTAPSDQTVQSGKHDQSPARLDPFADFPFRAASPEPSEAEPATHATMDLSTQVPLFVPPSEPVLPQWQNFHIAPVGKRAQGIVRDLSYMLGGILLFAAPFYWIAGRPPMNMHLLAGFLCGAALIALLYGTLFLAVFGETPGMTAAGLRVVSFSGHPATMPQKMLRVAGALVSTGSFLFGYLWAFVDEEKLYWHDHISKTVLTDSID